MTAGGWLALVLLAAAATAGVGPAGLALVVLVFILAGRIVVNDMRNEERR